MASSPEDNYPKLFLTTVSSKSVCYTIQIKKTHPHLHTALQEKRHVAWFCLTVAQTNPLFYPACYGDCSYSSEGGVCVCVCAYCCSALPIKQTQTCSCDTDREQRSQRAVTLRFHSVKRCLLSHLLQSKTAHTNKQYMFWCNHICYIHLNREVF